jgi:hypothetical protein
VSKNMAVFAPGIRVAANLRHGRSQPSTLIARFSRMGSIFGALLIRHIAARSYHSFGKNDPLAIGKFNGAKDDRAAAFNDIF